MGADDFMDKRGGVGRYLSDLRRQNAARNGSDAALNASAPKLNLS